MKNLKQFPNAFFLFLSLLFFFSSYDAFAINVFQIFNDANNDELEPGDNVYLECDDNITIRWEWPDTTDDSCDSIRIKVYDINGIVINSYLLTGINTTGTTTLYFPFIGPNVPANYQVTFDYYTCDLAYSVQSRSFGVIQYGGRPQCQGWAGPDVVLCSGNANGVTLGLPTNPLSNVYSWNTSPVQTTPQITVTTPGVYIVTVKDSNNLACECSDTVIVTTGQSPIADAGADQYICGSFATISIGGGSYDPANTYFWQPSYNITTLNSNMTNVYPYVTTTYFVTVTDNNTGCQDVDSITVFVQNAPTLNVTGDFEVCKGSCGTLTATSNGNLFLSYSIYTNMGGLIGQPPQYGWLHSLTAPGSSFGHCGNAYVTFSASTAVIPAGGPTGLFVAQPAGCITSLTYYIPEINCCFENKPDQEPIVTLRSAQTITGNPGDLVAWTGKNFVSGDIVVDKVTLDLTNVDVVFKECTGITFLNGARLRANNSVLRICNEHKSWKGLTFLGGGNAPHTGERSLLNECIIKNAETALKVQGDASLKSVNNLFENCRIGIELNSTANFDMQGIVGNRFFIDNALPDSGICDTNLLTSQCVGVWLRQANNLGKISQNDFINNVSYNANPVYYSGIINNAPDNHIKISQNRFTNMFNGVFLDQSGVTEIENNTFEILEPDTLAAYQIALNYSNAYVSIVGNEFNQSERNFNKQSNNVAIYIENSQKVSAIENNINGFYVGIQSENSFDQVISENNILNSGYNGIYTNNCQSTQISCNKVDMNFNYGLPSGSLGISNFDLSSNSKVFSNCIFDSEVAMLFKDNSVSQTIPYIKNNFLYNYAGVGIFVDGYTGNIGTTADPGMNTFYSNLSVPDINSINPISLENNYINSSAVLGSVSISGNTNVYSTASCGLQINGQPSQVNLDTSLICNNSLSFIYPMNQNYYAKIEEIEEVANQQDYSEFVFLVNSLASTPEGIIQLNDWLKVTRSPLGFVSLVKMYIYSTNLNWDNLLLAYGDLSKSNVLNSDESLIILNSLLKSSNQNPVSSSALFDVAQGNSRANEAAYMGYVGKNNTNQYRFKSVRISETTFTKDKLQGNSLPLELFPVPTEELLNIKIISQDFSDQGDFSIILFDLMGKQLMNRKTSLKNGLLQVNVKDLPKGVYTLSLENQSGNRIGSSRFIKN